MSTIFTPSLPTEQVRLTRTVRTEWRVGHHGCPDRESRGALADGIVPTIEVEVTIEGVPDRTGYVASISDVDRTVRAWAGQPARAHEGVLAHFQSLSAASSEGGLVGVAMIAMRPSPDLTFFWKPSMPHSVQIVRSYEFAASHRLALRGCSDQENHALFGKCSNPNGHGHNYRLEVCVEPGGATPDPVSALDRVVADRVMARLDHKHLNLDCPEFAELNPSVEHIALVCRDLLQDALASVGLTLVTVTVWETARTRATIAARPA